MLRNTAPGQSRSVRVRSRDNARKPPQLVPTTKAEAAYSDEKIRRQHEERVKHHATNANDWIAYVKFEGERDPQRALQVAQRAARANPCVDIYLQVIKYDPSQALDAIKRFPNSEHIRSAAYRFLSPEDARTQLAEWVQDDPSWFEVFIDLEMHYRNYELVSTLFQHWSANFGADISLWRRAARFELQNGSKQGFLEICAMALHALFFSNPKDCPRDRIDFFLDFLENCGWPNQECKAICIELQKIDVTPMEFTILKREEYRYAVLAKGTTIEQMKSKMVKGTSILRQTKHFTDEDGRRFLFESHLATEAPDVKAKAYLTWAFGVIDYAEYCNDLKTYQRCLALCKYSAILIASFTRFVKKNYAKQEAEELIIECMRSNPDYFPTADLLELDLVKQSPHQYRDIFYYRLGRAATSIKSWFAIIDFEELCGNYDACRSLFELGLEQVKSWKQLGAENLWQKYAQFEHRRGTHKSYVNVLRRWFKTQYESSPYLWDEVVLYWQRRHGKQGVRGALYAASQLTQGKARQDHIKRAPVIKRQYKV